MRKSRNQRMLDKEKEMDKKYLPIFKTKNSVADIGKQMSPLRKR